MLELLEDVTGMNDAGLVCHPYKFKRGDKKGLYSYTQKSDNKTFEGINEKALRVLIERGDFNETGRIFMVPAGSVNTDHHGALNVYRYKDERLPIRAK
jgi:hypothetical protein